MSSHPSRHVIHGEYINYPRGQDITLAEWFRLINQNETREIYFCLTHCDEVVGDNEYPVDDMMAGLLLLLLLLRQTGCLVRYCKSPN